MAALCPGQSLGLGRSGIQSRGDLSARRHLGGVGRTGRSYPAEPALTAGPVFLRTGSPALRESNNIFTVFPRKWVRDDWAPTCASPHNMKLALEALDQLL